MLIYRFLRQQKLVDEAVVVLQANDDDLYFFLDLAFSYIFFL